MIAEKDIASENLKKHAVNWLRGMHFKDNGLLLDVRVGDDYGSSIAIKNLEKGALLYIKAAKNEKLDVFDDKEELVGRVLNLSPLNYGDFVSTFIQLYGKSEIAIEFLGIGKEGEGESGDWIQYRARVIDDPIRIGRILEVEASQHSRSVDSQ